jgi:hypothetical protein
MHATSKAACGSRATISSATHFLSSSYSPAVGGDTAILPLMSMRHPDALASRFGATAVLGGGCVISATLGHATAEIASDRAGADNENSHFDFHHSVAGRASVQENLDAGKF